MQAGGAFVHAAIDRLAQVAGGPDAAKRDALASGLREKLDVKVVADEGGQRRLSFALPSREMFADLTRGLVALLLGKSGEHAPGA